MSIAETQVPKDAHDVVIDGRDPFHFDMGGHELVDPEVSDGKVSSIEPAVAECTFNGTELPGNVRIYDVLVSDPFVDADPAGYALVQAHIEKIERAMQSDGFNPLLGGRSEATERSEWNEYTSAWLRQPELHSLGVWRDNVPTANALGYLTGPWVGIDVKDHKRKDGLTGVISPETAAHLRFVDDAVGIRDRAVAMQEIAERFIGEEFRPGETVRWLSLASGTAEPSIKAALAVEDGNSVAVELTVADYDGRALSYVRSNADRLGFSGKINTVQQNILSGNIAGELEESTSETPKFDVVENMGFEEYLPQEGDELEAKKGLGLPQASDFTKEAWDMVKPGGMLISGNMVLDRPQIGFVFGIVDWPIINARSEQSILRVYKEAGILDDPSATVEMFRIWNEKTGGRVYNIVKVTKAKS